MTTPKEILWEIKPHTLAKHAILKRYLGAWFGIMGKTNQRILYLDGFCGPGRYKGGEDGSPILALKLALEHYQKGNIRDATFAFIDDCAARIEHLDMEIAKLSLPNSFIVQINCNQFENTMSIILDSLDKKGTILAPTFAFIDPFGPKGAPFSLVKRLLKNPKTEVLINIMADSINRFIEHPNLATKRNIQELFGTPEVLSILQRGNKPLIELRKLYQEQLSTCADFVGYFELRDGNNRIIYYLFFATKNKLGFIRMKEAFWKIDSSAGTSFSDGTNPNQGVLFKQDPIVGLKSIILEQFKSKNTSTNELTIFVEEKTPYMVSHLKKVLSELEKNNEISIEEIKNDGSKRRKGTFPPGVGVQFK